MSIVVRKRPGLLFPCLIAALALSVACGSRGGGQSSAIPAARTSHLAKLDSAKLTGENQTGLTAHSDQTIDLSRPQRPCRPDSTPSAVGPGLVKILYGDGQSAVAGGMPPLPLAVEGTSDSIITFISSDCGVELFPQSVRTNRNWGARVMVRMPDTPFATFTVTATSSAGGSATFTLHTGPRLLRMFGNSSGPNGAVAADGTVVTVGQPHDIGNVGDPDSVGGIINPDGTFRTHYGSILKRLNAPDYPRGKDALGVAVNIGPDQRIYTHGPIADSNFLVGLKSDLTIDHITDYGAYAGVGLVNGNWCVDARGHLYSQISSSQLAHIDPDGNLLGTVYFLRDSDQPPGGIGVNAAGNIVIAAGRGSPISYSLDEYNLSGDLVGRHPLPYGTSSPRMRQDANGNFLVLSLSTVSSYDQSYNLRFSFDSRRFDYLAGGDANDHVYLISGLGEVRKFDRTGELMWVTGSSPAAQFPRISVFINPFRYGDVTGIAIDPANSLVYVTATFGGLIFQHEEYKSSFGGSGQGMALSPAHELYKVGFDVNSRTSSLYVLDSTGQSLRTVTVPGTAMGGGIAIDASGKKYIGDSLNHEVHILGANDVEEGVLPFQLPAGYSFHQPPEGGVDFDCTAGVSTSPDGNLVVFDSCVVSQNTWVSWVAKMSLSGTVLWSKLVTTGSLVRNVAVDAAGRVWVLQDSSLQTWSSEGNAIGTLDMTYSAPGARFLGLAAAGNEVYFYLRGTVYVVSGD